MLVNVLLIQMAITFLCPQVAKCQQRRQPPIGVFIGWVRQEAGPVKEIQASGRDDTHIQFLGGSMGAYDAGECITVGDSNSRLAVGICLFDHLLRMGGPA